MDERVWHYIRPNETVRMPRRHIFLDTESKRDKTKNGYRQIWRLGVAAYRQADKGRPARDYLRAYDDPRTLWTDVSQFTKPRTRTVLWAHNLGYDVRIADAFRALPALGWRLDAHNLANRGTWLHWTNAGRTLLMVDSTSVFPAPLATLAKSFMHPKMPLPKDSDPDRVWRERCIRDVEILRQAIVSYLEWIEAKGLGSWRMTGAAQSYAAFRSKHLTHNMMVHADADAIAAERRAMWTGRCEAYWRGNTGNVGIEEWDLSLAYPRIAEREEVPTRLIGPMHPSNALAAALHRPRTALLADVEVETDRPTVPTKVDGRMAWPVGRFETTLWTPELRLLAATGAKVTVTAAWRYQTAPALQAWARWIMGELAETNPHTEQWQRLILKHWARALIGRFGMSYTKWSRYGTTTGHDVRASTVYDVQTGEEYELSHVGNTVARSDGVVEWVESQPAITGYIMSCARVWLWDLLQAMPEQSVLYADTDSFYITREHHDAAWDLAQSPIGQGLRLKASYRRANFLGPRQIITDGRPRMAGIPRSADVLPNGTLAGEVWASLTTSLLRGEASTVTTTDRTWKVSGADHRRAPGNRGWTQPLTVGRG